MALEQEQLLLALALSESNAANVEDSFQDWALLPEEEPQPLATFEEGPTFHLTDSQLARHLVAGEDHEQEHQRPLPSKALKETPTNLTDSQLARQLAAEEESGNSLSSFQDQMDEDQAMMRAIKESRREIEEQERRALREQQEREFQETLLMDQLKEQEKENKRKQEEACKEEVSRLRALLPDDVTIEHAKAEQAKSAGVGRCICALVVRLPDGSRLERRFWGDSTLLDVKHFVDLYLLERQQAAVAGEAREGPDPSRPGPWEHYYFATSLPQKKFTNWTETLEEAALCPRAILYMQEQSEHKNSGIP